MIADLTDEFLEEKALRLGQLAMTEKDPVEKIALFVEAMSYYTQYKMYTAPHPEVCVSLGKVGECILSFYRSTKPVPPATLDSYVCNAAYCINLVRDLYETAASYFDRSNLEVVLEAREKLSDLMDRELYVKAVAQDGTITPYTREEVFKDRLVTATAGYPLSQLRIVEAYMKGDGVERSWPKAYLWAQYANKNRDGLSCAQASELMALSAELVMWKNNNPVTYLPEPSSRKLRGVETAEAGLWSRVLRANAPAP